MAGTTTVNDSTLAAEPQTQRQNNLRALLLALLAAVIFAWWWLELRETTGPAPSDAATGTPSVTIGPGDDIAPVAPSEPSSQVAAKQKPATSARPRTPSSTIARPLASNPVPKYPPAALRRNEGGTVLLRVSIGSDGNPTDIDVAQRSGSRDLDRAAINAVHKWRFNPATRNGQPVASAVLLPVEFRPTELASL